MFYLNTKWWEINNDSEYLVMQVQYLLSEQLLQA